MGQLLFGLHTLGYDLEFSMDSGNMRLTGTPYADLSAYASAVVHLGIAKGGVRGTMTLIRDDYENSVSFGNVKLVNGGTALAPLGAGAGIRAVSSIKQVLAR